MKAEESFIDKFIACLTNRYNSKELDPFDKFKLDEILNMLRLKKKDSKFISLPMIAQASSLVPLS